MEGTQIMKKLALLFALLMIIPATLVAAEPAGDMLAQKVRGLLTEVYGYTQEEAEAFNIDVAQEDSGAFYMRFYTHPDWVYTATILKEDQRFADSYTPFNTFGMYKASENSVRYMLRTIRENGWFDDWTPDSKAAFGEAVAWCGDIRVNASMERGLQSDGYPPAQALEDLFLSCYGDTSLWLRELME